MQLNISNTPEPEMTTTAQQTVAEQNSPVPPPNKVNAKAKKRNDSFKAKIDACRSYKRRLIANWSTSIDYRRGKPSASQDDSKSNTINPDWSLTKTKQAALFSQVPKVRVNHPPDSLEAGPWVGQFERRLNDTFVVAGIEAAMYECVPDCINASGFAAALVSFESITEDKEVPKMDMSILPPQIQAQVLKSGMFNGQEVEMETVPETKDKRYLIQRISPSDFLFPINFIGSNFDSAPWLGRSGRITWPEAVQKYKVTEAEKEKIVGDDKPVLDQLTYDVEKDRTHSEEMVGFDEIFYKEFHYNEEAKSYHTIHHLVFLSGKDEPVVDEPWKGQEIDEASGSIIGSRKLPIRVLTLTYITDEAIPPSDSAIARPIVDRMNKFHNQMDMQRERSIPVRWFDVNRLDSAVQVGLMRGTWQGMIPVQGDGTRVLGEVAKAAMPPEDFTADQIYKSILSESWTIGPNQQGSGADIETKGESGEIASNFQTRVGLDRSRVASFVVGIAEVLGGLMCLMEDPASFGEGFNPQFSAALAFSILADSTVLVDANQRLERLNAFVNTYAKSGYVVLEPVLKEIATLTGLDPSVVIKAPDPEPPEKPNISLRLTGKEDMMHPLMLAFLIESGQAPKEASINQAMKLIQMAVVPPPPPPLGPDGLPLPPGPPVDPNAPPVDPNAPPGGPPPTPVGEANPNMTILPKISKRSDDPSAGGKEG